MTDETQPKKTEFWKIALVGAGIATAATAGAVIGNSQHVSIWPEDKAPPQTTIAMAAPVETAMIPPPMPAIDPTTLVRGVINPVNESTIASKMTARITAMPYGEGQSFAAGALLASFDCSQVKAELNAAQAAASAYKKTYDTNVELDQYEAIGKNEVAVSKANLGKATAEAAAVATQLNDCDVRAPFAGKVVEQIAHAREIAASGQPLFKIQSGRDVEMELIVPSKWLTWLKPGAGFGFKIDETGTVIRGAVKRFGASVDPVSKTIRVTGVVTSRKGNVLPGMSGTATFDDARAKAPLAPQAAPSQIGSLPPIAPQKTVQGADGKSG
jgi:membrane fusion protein, multidrug efflux system